MYGLLEDDKISFEKFVEKNASANIFDNDLLEAQYKFWETPTDKEKRLKKIWINLKRKNALGGIDMPTREENMEMNTDIAELIRHIRWRVDQELTRRNIEPLFKDNYTDKYDKHEFLIDADVEFSKIKKLMEKNPSMLRSDPILSLDYFKIIDLIKQKKMLEQTSDHFDPENSFLISHNDEQMLEKDKLEKMKDRLEAYNSRVSTLSVPFGFNDNRLNSFVDGT
jgi:hypothetical protein